MCKNTTAQIALGPECDPASSLDTETLSELLQGKHPAALLETSYSTNTKWPHLQPLLPQGGSDQLSLSNHAHGRHLGQTCRGFPDTKPSPELRLPGPSPGDPAGAPGSDRLLGNGSDSAGTHRAAPAATCEPVSTCFCYQKFYKTEPWEGAELSRGSPTPRKLPAES